MAGLGGSSLALISKANSARGVKRCPNDICRSRPASSIHQWSVCLRLAGGKIMASNTPIGGPHPILIIDDELTHLSTLPQILERRVAECHFNLSSSYEQAREQIRTKRYHAVLSNARFAGMRDFSLIHLNQSFQPSTPFIVTARREDADLISEALRRGSVDLIAAPFDEQEAAAVVQIALWLYQLRRTIEHKEEHLAVLRRQCEMLARILPHELERAQHVERDLRDEEQSLASCTTTMGQVETSLRLLIRAAQKLEDGSRQRAWERLHSLITRA
ncbi:MAG TPA: response regulator [Nitrospira sp.]|nr:response regulator [Nitrospira sp.]